MMKLVERAKLWSKTASVLGVVGLSGLAVLGGVKPAEAENINKGTDYFESPSGGSSFVFDINDTPSNFNDDLVIPLKGRRIKTLPGVTDTVVQRQEDAVFDEDGDGILEHNTVTINIEMTQLSLESDGPVDINGTMFDVFATLDPNHQSTGEMTITHNTVNLSGGQLGFNDSGAIQGTFDSFLNVFYKVDLTPVDGGEVQTIFENFLLTQSGASWSHTPPPEPDTPTLVRPKNPVVSDILQDPNCHTNSGDCAPTDFFAIGEVKHQKGSPDFPNGHTTIISPVPEPLTILGSGAALVFGVFFKKQSRKSKKQDVA